MNAELCHDDTLRITKAGSAIQAIYNQLDKHIFNHVNDGTAIDAVAVPGLLYSLEIISNELYSIGEYLDKKIQKAA